MIRFALTAFYRSLARHRLYAAINIGGLAVGLAVFLVLGLYVRFETSYEKWLPHHDEIYLVEASFDGSRGETFSNNSPIALWSATSRDLPHLVGTRVRRIGAAVVRNGIGVRETVDFVDPDFSRVFELPMVQGDLRTALADPAGLVLTRASAAKYFGRTDPIGRTMSITAGGETRNYRVAAVAEDLPRNTDLNFDMLARLVIPPNDGTPRSNEYYQWNYFNPETYVRLAGPGAAERLTADLKGVIARHARSETTDSNDFKMGVRVQPFPKVHFEEPGRSLAVTTLGVVGLLTLLIAIVNYVNLATARAGLRAREVAMRKVLGADRRTILLHYLGEAICTALIAGVIGLALAELALPLVNAAADLSLSLRYFGRDGVLLPLAGLVVLVGIAAGVYPALVLSRFPVASVLASARSPGGGRAGARIREALVVAQFAVAIAFVIGTLVLTAQTRHVRNADVGYARDGLIMVPSLGNSSLTDGQRETVLHRLAGLPGVTSAAIANNAPGPGSFASETNIAIPGDPGQGPTIRFFQTMPGFFETVGAKLLAGRLFSASRAADVNANYARQAQTTPYNIVVNRKALRFLHIARPEDAIGRTFVTPHSADRTIIGVVEDMRFEDARDPIPPTMYEFVVRPPSSAIALLRFTGDPKALTEAARAVWRQEAAAVPFDAMTATQNLARLYRSDDRSAHLFTIGAVLAVAIGCIGLWGLASFNTARRVKEIGIRKVLGASSADIVRLLVVQFLRPVLIANLFAWPLAFVAMRTWLAGFDDRIALSPLFFVAATALALAIAVATVIAQSLRAARATPAWALRHD